jgi:hypothetical protein
MASRQARYADNVDIVFNGLTGGLLGSLEKRTNIHVTADIGKGRGNQFGAAVMAVLPYFDNQNTGTAAIFIGESPDSGANLGKRSIPVIGRAVDA